MSNEAELTYGIANGCRFVRLAWVPMRDGTRLATTIFLPLTEGRYPVVIQRTPYNRMSPIQGWKEWTDNGFVFICQDVRGRYDSDGDFEPFLQEIKDTPDTIAWVRQQDWCNGKVGLMGPSYLGWVQFLAVAGLEGEMPDAILPTFVTGDAWLRGFYNRGPLSVFLVFWWLCFDVGSRTNNSSLLEIYNLEELWKRLPLETQDVSCGAGMSRVWREFMAHPTFDSYWERYSIRGKYDRFTMPVLHVCGWYDYYPSETIFNWQSMVKAAKTPEIAASHKLVLGPWGHHHGLDPTGDGQRVLDFGPESRFDAPKIYRAWFKRLFKGERSPDGLGESPVRIFVMGRNVWRDENEWPLARTRYVNYYLHSGGRANTGNGDGRLDTQSPQSEPVDRYDYDPANPVPTRGGNHSIGPWNESYKKLIWCGPCDQRPNEARADMLVYTSEPLEADLEVTGNVILHLFASSSACDTDFVGRLVDVYPDGQAINITEGVVRARYRSEEWNNPQLIEPGKVLPYKIDLQATSNVFLKGHCLRLEVTSSNFPLWDRNLNTGEHPNRSAAMQVAQQAVYHEKLHPSHLILPVIPA